MIPSHSILSKCIFFHKLRYRWNFVLYITFVWEIYSVKVRSQSIKSKESKHWDAIELAPLFLEVRFVFSLFVLPQEECIQWKLKKPKKLLLKKFNLHPVEIQQTAITTKNVTIPLEELKLLVKPLTVEELQNESSAWMLLLKNKVQQISCSDPITRKPRPENKTILEPDYLRIRRVLDPHYLRIDPQ